jgi:hypothetical protein
VPAGVFGEARIATDVLPLAAFVVSVIAVPVNVGALFVPAGVPPLTALVVWFAVPVNTGMEFVPAGVPAESLDVLWLDVPVKTGAATVPAGVPPLTLDVVPCDPVNVGAATVPAAATVFAPPVFSGVSKSVSAPFTPTMTRPCSERGPCAATE